MAMSVTIKPDSDAFTQVGGTYDKFTVCSAGVIIEYGETYELLIPWHRVVDIYSDQRGALATLPL